MKSEYAGQNIHNNKNYAHLYFSYFHSIMSVAMSAELLIEKCLSIFPERQMDTIAASPATGPQW